MKNPTIHSRQRAVATAMACLTATAGAGDIDVNHPNRSVRWAAQYLSHFLESVFSPEAMAGEGVR